MHIDKYTIAGTTFDRRVKLSVLDKEEIKSKYSSGSYSLRELGREYKVDKKTIKHIVDEAAYSESKEYAKLYLKEQRENQKDLVRKNHTKKVQQTREYKRTLLKENKLVGIENSTV